MPVVGLSLPQYHLLQFFGRRWRFPCAHERLGETSSAAVAAMNSRRFIRSSSQLEDDHSVSIIVAPLRAASPMRANRLRMLPPLTVTAISSDGVGKSAKIEIVAARATAQ